MARSKLLELGMEEQIVSCQTWALPRVKTDPNLYYKDVEDEPVILLLYLDDLFLIGNEKQIVECKKNLAEEFLDERPWVNTLFPRS